MSVKLELEPCWELFTLIMMLQSLSQIDWPNPNGKHTGFHFDPVLLTVKTATARLYQKLTT